MKPNHWMKSALESMLFVYGEPLNPKEACQVFSVTEKEVAKVLEDLKKEYQQEQRGLRLLKVNDSYQMVTAQENEEYIRRLCTPIKKRRLSQSALEVLAIIAYRQPVTRGEIEEVRGIKCERVLEGLMGKDFIKEVGRAETIGRPILYGTTEKFLQHFGIETIQDLPPIEDIEAVIEEEKNQRQGVIVNQISLDEMTKK